MIELHNVTKKFDKFVAVDNISLRVEAGDLFGFLGPNGAGKTTTIKMIVGLFSPTAGTIRVNGFDTVSQPIEAKTTLAYVPDQPFLYDKLTGREFMYFAGGLYRIEKETLHTRIKDVIELFEIGQWIDKRSEDYSQGMRQRVSIAAALLHRPKTLVIDEPMIGLDPRSAKIVRETLIRLSQEGVSIFMSTHSLPVAEELCNRIGIINNARLVFVDTQDKLKVYKEQFDGKLESLFLELTK